MLLGGLQKLTLIDYPGKISATVFTIGCNFACSFCHNSELVDVKKIKNQPIISEKVFFDFLKTRQRDLEGVCITGGEPTLHKDLPEFIKKIKEMDFAVKLDTNGTNPKMLEELINKKLVDYIAMDIKGPLKRYPQMSNRKVNLKDIEKSVRLIKDTDDYEFRTTIVPKLHKKEDILDMAKWLKGSKRYFLQQFYPSKTLNPDFQKEKSYSIEELKEFCQIIKPYFEHCEVRS